MFRTPRLIPCALAALLAAALWLPAAPAAAASAVAAAPAGPTLAGLAWSVQEWLARALAAWGFAPAAGAKEGAGLDPDGEPQAAEGAGLDPLGEKAGAGLDPDGGPSSSSVACGDAGPGLDPDGNPCRP